MPRRGKLLLSEISRGMLATMLVLALLALQGWAQDVSPRLLAAAQAAYRQQPGLDPPGLTFGYTPPPGQQRASSTQFPPSSDWNVLYHLHVGDSVTCQTKDGLTHRGKFTAVSEEAITLEVGKRQVTLLRHLVVNVRVHQRDHHGKTALLGAAIGFAVPMLALYLPADRGDPDAHVGPLILGTICAGIGAVAGAIVGWPKETIIYRARPESSVR